MFKKDLAWICSILIFLGVFPLLYSGNVFSGISMAPEEHISNTEAMDDYIINSGFSGAVLVANGEKILLNKGYGYARAATKIPNDTNTVFELGSITKQFTAMGILILKERGLLDLNDPVNRYFPEFPLGEDITIYHLLTQTSGIGEYFTDAMYFSEKQYGRDEILDTILNGKPMFNPGEKFMYCNSNYYLLGCIIEKVSNTTYAEFVEENIFSPLGMQHSQYGMPLSNESKVALGYTRNQRQAAPPNFTPAYAAGALTSTVSDLYLWERGLYTETLVGHETLDTMFTPYKGGYGCGWRLTQSAQVNTAKHSGYINGFTSLIYRDINNRGAIIILSNQDSSDLPDRIANFILSLPLEAQ